MKKTVQFAYAATLAALIAIPALHAEEGVCHRCEVIREDNKTSHQNYEYYEDYLKSQNGGQKQTSSAPAQKKADTSKGATPSATKNEGHAQPVEPSSTPQSNAFNHTNKAPVKSGSNGNAATQDNLPKSVKSS